MGSDLRLVEKGRGEPRDALVQEGKVHVALGKQYEAELDEHGWSPGDTKDLETNVTTVETAMGSQATARSTASNAAADEGKAVDDAKTFMRRLRNALPRAIREAPDAGVKAADFAVTEALNRSTPRISKYLTTIRPAVEKLNGALAKAFKNPSALDLLDGVKAALDKADTTQELARKNAPDQTLALYEAMGRVLEQVEDMNRAGRSAFDGDAQTAAKFNKDVLLRGRKTKKPAAEDGAGANGASAGANGASAGANGASAGTATAGAGGASAGGGTSG